MSRTLALMLAAGVVWLSDNVAMAVPADQAVRVSYFYTGSPFFNDNYKFADITMNRGRRIVNVKTKIDLEMQQVQFLSFNNVEAVMEAGTVKEVSYADTTADGIIFYKFRTGFPAIDGKGRNNFYILLADGNCSLLRSVEKKVTESKNVIDNTVMKDYETYEMFYLLIKGEMKRLKKEKEFLLTELSDKQPQLEAFIESNKLNLRQLEHIAKLVNYYNTL
jgi:hypothetical protein